MHDTKCKQLSISTMWLTVIRSYGLLLQHSLIPLMKIHTVTQLLVVMQWHHCWWHALQVLHRCSASSQVGKYIMAAMRGVVRRVHWLIQRHRCAVCWQLVEFADSHSRLSVVIERRTLRDSITLVKAADLVPVRQRPQRLTMQPPANQLTECRQRLHSRLPPSIHQLYSCKRIIVFYNSEIPNSRTKESRRRRSYRKPWPLWHSDLWSAYFRGPLSTSCWWRYPWNPCWCLQCHPRSSQCPKCSLHQSTRPWPLLNLKLLPVVQRKFELNGGEER